MTTSTIYIGVDEAGKGPVIGSMFVSAVAVPDLSNIPDSVADSKQLSDASREVLATQIAEHNSINTATIEVSPSDIDAPETDMNTLTVSAHATAITNIIDTHTASDVAVVVDASDVNPERFASRIQQQCNPSFELEATHKADVEYPIVAAASIVAKTRRESHISDLASEYGEIGSGYPSDQTTRDFLSSYIEDHGSLPPFARESWQTCDDLLAAAEQSGLDEF